MQNMQNEWLMQLLTGGYGGGRQWFEVGYLLCLFGVVLFRRQYIHNIKMFRRAYILFGLSIILPPVIRSLLGFSNPPWNTGATVGLQSYALLLHLVMSLGSVLLGLSIMCALGALVPSFIPPPEGEPDDLP